MNTTLKSLAACAAAVLALASCETYRVEAPEVTAVADVDGNYICLAYDASAKPVSLFDITITNTAANEPDRVWVTLVDYGYAKQRFVEKFGAEAFTKALATPDAIRFDARYDSATGTLTATSVKAEDTSTCRNLKQEKGYYTCAYMYKEFGMSSYTVSFSAKVTKDGVDTATGYKSDKIEITSYSRSNDSMSLTYASASGMKNTGWGDDMKEYADFIDNNYVAKKK